ncbi:hypothetical protein FB565_003973 [Actinoplanes lutulentus]|uniref:Uncharacterized protein n=1 Tax=Actinoplanes lutulentus TaxID=1287878 RepID=A0A327ZII8_9ACTN|nr:hypothetical protein [Actinoplanes lutulentus]MBB2944244.1 hypothetical protein [Actinoplanes lutulentus]RAK42523.1 hypothetical protein B0I29_102348 [Actinoplanes lutulentus]
MSMSIGTSTPPTTRDTHAAWLRRRAEDQSFNWSSVERASLMESERRELQPALV